MTAAKSKLLTLAALSLLVASPALADPKSPSSYGACQGTMYVNGQGVVYNYGNMYGKDCDAKKAAKKTQVLAIQQSCNSSNC